LDRKEIIERLFSLPGEIRDAELEVFSKQLGITSAKDALSAKEADLYTEGVIDGKNAEIRTAQLRQLTIKERNDVAKAENDANMARIKLNYLHNEFKSLQTIAYLIEGVERVETE